MKGKLRISKEEEFLPTSCTYEAVESSLVNRPLKSPSPDKKSANIIVSTRSPDIHELKRSSTPTRDQFGVIRASQRSELRQKNFQFIITPSQRKEAATFKNLEPTAFRTSQPSSHHRRDSGGENPSPPNSRSRNIKIEIAADDDVEVRHSASRYRSQFRGQLSELDYLRILKAKEESISELKDYITSLERRTPENSLLATYESRISDYQSEIKQLKIQNQHLYNAMEKEKERARAATHSSRDETLQRENRELRETLKIRDSDFEELARKLDKERQERKQSQAENQALMRLLKERGREPEQRRQQPLSASSLSQQRSGSDKERLSLVKIKELHQENLKIAKESFYSEVQNLENNFLGQLDQLNSQVDELNARLAHLESLRRQSEDHKDRSKGLDARQQVHRQSERHQEIQSVLLDRNSHYERLLQEQRRDNQQLRKESQKIAGELGQARKQIEELQARSLTYSRDVTYLPQDDQDPVDTLRRENEQLVYNLARLEKDLDDAQQQVRAVQREKEDAIQQQEEKLVLILDEYQSKIKVEREEHQQLVTMLRDEHEKKQRELEEQHERDKAEIEMQLKDALKLYDKENSGLKQSVLQKNSEIIYLGEQSEKLKAELHQIRHSERKDSQELAAAGLENDLLKNRILALQKNVEALTQENEEAAANEIQMRTVIVDLQGQLRQTDRVHQSLKKQLKSLQEEREKLTRDLLAARERLAENQESQVEVLGRLRADLDEKDGLLNTLNSKLADSQRRADEAERQQELLQRMVEALRAQRSSLQFATIQEELIQLRAMIAEYYAKNKNRLDNEIVEDYFRLVHTHELKIDENLKLAKEVEELRGQLAADSREKLLLTEKISLLESNIVIYQRELRERRQLYEQVLQEKVRVEKEALLSKRIKTEQASLVEGFKSSTTEITSKIDRLVDFQRERYRQIRALVQQRPL